MDSSWKESKLFIPELEQESILRLKDWAGILDLVREEVLAKAECPQKFFGFEDKESWEGFWKNIEPPRRLTAQFIINFTLLQRVTNSRTKQFWLKQSLSKRPKRSRHKNWKPNKKPGDKRTKSAEKKERTDKNVCDHLNQYFTIQIVMNAGSLLRKKIIFHNISDRLKQIGAFSKDIFQHKIRFQSFGRILIIQGVCPVV